MDQNLPIVTKKVWNIVRVAFYILKKSINKKKLLLDLNLFIKRGKFVAEKTLNNILFHHNHQLSTTFDDEYVFSCTNTPLYRHYLATPKIKHNQNCMAYMGAAITARQLRVTDSPYPLQIEGGDEGVDEAAEEFIKRFYSQLKQQT